MSDVTIEEWLARIEAKLDKLAERQTAKEFYEIEEFAVLVGKAPFTVREWARLGRIHALKRKSGRGAHAQWVISHGEYERFQRDGLLPNPIHLRTLRGSDERYQV